jgi:anti-anti-sigma factor
MPPGSPVRPVRTLDEGGVRVVRVTGAVDVFNAASLPREAVAGLPSGAREIVIDLEAVSYLDSAGISAIVKLVRQLRSADISARATIGADSTLSPTIVDLLRQVVPVDDA